MGIIGPGAETGRQARLRGVCPYGRGGSSPLLGTATINILINMAFFTGKGDDGTTKKFDTPSGERLSKDSAIIEALGCLDEVNSYLGQCKIESQKWNYRLGKTGPFFFDLVHDMQENLFIVQAEFAGAPKRIKKTKVTALEKILKEIEKELPPIRSFFISGGTELATRFDFARTLARRAERRAVSVKKVESLKIGKNTIAYLNRLSSVLYALARLSNYKFGAEEKPPLYK